MKVSSFNRNILVPTALVLFSIFLVFTSTHADDATTTVTTTTTNADGSTTTTVEETTAEAKETQPETQPPPTEGGQNIVGPAGVTGTIRRSDRRQDRR